MDHYSGRACYETHFSAQQSQAQARAWFPSPNGDQAGTSGIESKARQRPGPVDAVTRDRPADAGASAPPGFSRARRLTQSSEFRRVFARPRRSSDRLFTVLARENGGRGPRLGLAISKRAAKRAVQRNRLKRIAREVFRRQDLLPSLDFVVLASPEARNAASPELHASLGTHFARLARRPASAEHG